MTEIAKVPQLCAKRYRACCVCDAEDARYKCSKCLIARYCSLGCQRKDWPIHKEYCELRPCQITLMSEFKAILKDRDLLAVLTYLSPLLAKGMILHIINTKIMKGDLGLQFPNSRAILAAPDPGSIPNSIPIFANQIPLYVVGIQDDGSSGVSPMIIETVHSDIHLQANLAGFKRGQQMIINRKLYTIPGPLW